MRPLLLVLLCLALPGQVFSMAMAVSLEQALKEGSFIGRVKILKCTPLPGMQSRNSLPEKQATDADTYSQLAKAEVIEVARGAKPGDIVYIEYDNGLGCPNVLYSEGNDRLVFAEKRKNGHLVTLNTYAGYWDIQDNKIADFDMFSTHKPALVKNSSPAQILAEFRLLLSAKSTKK